MASIDLEILSNKIELLVQAREAVEAAREIQKYLKLAKFSLGSVLCASDWWRRLGRYRDAYACLVRVWERDRQKPALQFKLAEALNSLGASTEALASLERSNPNSAEERFVAGCILMNNARSQDAIPQFEKMLELSPVGQLHQSRIRAFGLVDAYSNTGRLKQALALIDLICKHTTEPLLLAICHQARAETQVRAGQLKLAADSLQKALPLYPKGERTLDLGFFYKWQGYVLSLNGEKDKAASSFKKARSLLFRSDLRIEVFLDLLRLQQLVGVASQSEWSRAVHYPGLSQEFRNQLLCGNQLTPKWFGPANTNLKIDLGSRELWVGQDCHLDTSLEVQLLGLLILCGPWGIQSARLKSMLWPNEPYSYLQLDGRLDALKNRLKNRFRVNVFTEQGVLKLAKSSLQKLAVRSGGSERPSFLKPGLEFTRAILSRHFKMSSTQSKLTLANWLEKGWIKRIGAARAIYYRVLD